MTSCLTYDGPRRRSFAGPRSTRWDTDKYLLMSMMALQVGSQCEVVYEKASPYKRPNKPILQVFKSMSLRRRKVATGRPCQCRTCSSRQGTRSDGKANDCLEALGAGKGATGRLTAPHVRSVLPGLLQWVRFADVQKLSVATLQKFSVATLRLRLVARE